MISAVVNRQQLEGHNRLRPHWQQLWRSVVKGTREQHAVSLLALTALLLLCACGDGLTGGSVPPGNPGSTRLIGTVVDEEDPTLPIADAEVEILLEDGTLVVAKTDAGGTFVVELPRNKRCTVRVRPSIALLPLYQERLDSFVTDAEEVRLLIPLPRKGLAMPTIAQLQLRPEEVTLKVGERVQFELQVFFHSSPSDPLSPSQPERPLRPFWSVHGRIGVITPDGLFIATRPGRGFVRARVGDLIAEARVTVVE